MYIGRVGSVNFNGQTRLKKSNFSKTEPFACGDDCGTLTQYYDKNGNLVGFRRVHQNGIIERARQYPDGTVLITKKYNRHQPALVKGFDPDGNYHHEIPVINILGHNPNRRVVEEKWAEEQLMK